MCISETTADGKMCQPLAIWWEIVIASVEKKLWQVALKQKFTSVIKGKKGSTYHQESVLLNTDHAFNKHHKAYKGHLKIHSK